MSTTHRFPHSLKFCFSSLVRSHFTSFQLFLSSHTQIKSEKRAQVDWARQWVRFYFFRRRFKRSISKSEIVTCFGAFMCDIVGRRRHGRTQNETNVGIDSFFFDSALHHWFTRIFWPHREILTWFWNRKKRWRLLGSVIQSRNHKVD